MSVLTWCQQAVQLRLAADSRRAFEAGIVLDPSGAHRRRLTRSVEGQELGHMSVKEELAKSGVFVDIGIMSHGFTPYMRDYDVVFEALWGKTKWADAKGTYRLRFTHCPEVSTLTALSDAAYKQAWSDDHINFEQWIAAGKPDGYVWGASWSMAYVDDSPSAKQWSERFGRAMHEVLIVTEAYRLRVVFHDFTLTKLNDETHVLHKVMFPIVPGGNQNAG
jgi:hypothetical protein